MMPAAAPTNLPRVAVIIGDGRHDQFDWPTVVDVRTYPADLSEAKKIAASCRAGTFDAVIVHHRFTPTPVVRLLREQKAARVIVWDRSPVDLSREIVDLLEKNAIAVPRPSALQPPKIARLHEASAHPDRRPKWHEDEHAAILLAWDKAEGSRAKFVDQYVDLVGGLDVPARSMAEVNAELDRLLEERKRAERSAVEDLARARAELEALRTDHALAVREVDAQRAQIAELRAQLERAVATATRNAEAMKEAREAIAEQKRANAVAFQKLAEMGRACMTVAESLK